MIVSVVFKTPNAADRAVVSAIRNEYEVLDDDEFDEAKDSLHKRLQRWIKFGEVITVDFDISAGTATVREVT